MIKKTLEYKNYNGEKVTGDFYFDISESELLMLAWSERGGLDKHLERIINEEDNREILKIFTQLIDLSYGKRSLDGKDFDKSPENLRRFKASGAYNQLLLELFTQDENKENSFATQFANGLLPADLMERVRKAQEAERAKAEPSMSEQPAISPESSEFEQPTF